MNSHWSHWLLISWSFFSLCFFKLLIGAATLSQAKSILCFLDSVWHFRFLSLPSVFWLSVASSAMVSRKSVKSADSDVRIACISSTISIGVSTFSISILFSSSWYSSLCRSLPISSLLSLISSLSVLITWASKVSSRISNIKLVLTSSDELAYDSHSWISLSCS